MTLNHRWEKSNSKVADLEHGQINGNQNAADISQPVITSTRSMNDNLLNSKTIEQRYLYTIVNTLFKLITVAAFHF